MNIESTISATYNWCQFTPAFALVGLAALLLMAAKTSEKNLKQTKG